MGLFSVIFGTHEERTLKTCTELYDKAKRMRPGKSERDYLKIVLLAKPPFDYQVDGVINEILVECQNIADLAEMISYHGKSGSHLWESRKRNVRDNDIEDGNRKFFVDFWGQ